MGEFVYEPPVEFSVAVERNAAAPGANGTQADYTGEAGQPELDRAAHEPAGGGSGQGARPLLCQPSRSGGVGGGERLRGAIAGAAAHSAAQPGDALPVHGHRARRPGRRRGGAGQSRHGGVCLRRGAGPDSAYGPAAAPGAGRNGAFPATADEWRSEPVAGGVAGPRRCYHAAIRFPAAETGAGPRRGGTGRSDRPAQGWAHAGSRYRLQLRGDRLGARHGHERLHHQRGHLVLHTAGRAGRSARHAANGRPARSLATRGSSS